MNTEAVAYARQTGERILAQGEVVSNDMWQTGLNNNDLIIGPTGAGKTRSYVMPNVLQMNESFIVADTKGSLIGEVGPLLMRNGYQVLHLDFTDFANSCGYNPFDAVRTDPHTGKVREQDILRISKALCPTESTKDPFWDLAACNLMSCLIGFVFERLRKEDRNLGSVIDLLAGMNPSESGDGISGITEQRLDLFCEQAPRSFTARRWSAFRPTVEASRMYASILGILSEKLDAFSFDGALQMFCRSPRVDFKELGCRKTALFLTVSDTDRSMDRMVNLLYAQALQVLCDYADDECPGHALPIPVRLFLDDFATNCRIADFDKVISVIRSRNIAVSVVLQSITQLETLYTHPAAMTIVNGCDHLLYLGGQDVETARFIGAKAHKTVDTILDQAVDELWLLERGKRAKKVRRYDLTQHPRYAGLPEAQWAAYTRWAADAGTVEDAADTGFEASV